MPEVSRFYPDAGPERRALAAVFARKPKQARQIAHDARPKHPHQGRRAGIEPARASVRPAPVRRHGTQMELQASSQSSKGVAAARFPALQAKPRARPGHPTTNS